MLIGISVQKIVDGLLHLYKEIIEETIDILNMREKHIQQQN